MLTNNCVGCGTVAHLFCHAEHSLCVIPSIPFVSFRAHARNPVWMLCFAQHDKSDSVIPSESEESMTLFVLAKADASLRLRFVQNDKSRSVTPNACEESIVWMLRFAHHDKLGSWIPHFADASFSMTSAVSFRARARNPVWMLRFACALFSTTVHRQDIKA